MFFAGKIPFVMLDNFVLPFVILVVFTLILGDIVLVFSTLNSPISEEVAPAGLGLGLGLRVRVRVRVRVKDTGKLRYPGALDPSPFPSPVAHTLPKPLQSPGRQQYTRNIDKYVRSEVIIIIIITNRTAIRL